MGTSLRRIISVALSGVLVAGVTSVLTAPAASARGYDLDPVSWAYVDSATPKTAYVDPADTDMPVGARVFAGGTQHVNKAYVTFDLSSLRGSPVESARLSAYTTSLTNCATAGGTQAWLTATKTAPTWHNQPDEQLQLPAAEVSRTCPNFALSWDAAAVVSKALAEGRTTLTIELKLPDALLADPGNWRTYSPRLQLYTVMNERPEKPTDLEVGYQYCADAATTTYVRYTSGVLSARDYDTDGDLVSAHFEWWPTGHANRTQSADATDSYYFFYVPFEVPEGVPYSWRIRGSDATGPGPWSDTCTFVADMTKPAAAPVVTSTDYPSGTTAPGQGGTGVPGTFTFTAAGVSDVAEYSYRLGTGQYQSVKPSRLGGPASVVVVPTQAGQNRLTVTGIDRAGNTSPTAVYDFWVTENSPLVSCTPPSDFIGHPRACTATPRLADTTGYVYSLDGGAEVAVPVNPDGTAAFTVRPMGGTDTTSHLVVRSTTDAGKRSDPTDVALPTDPGIPTIDVPTEPVPMGQPASVTMHAVLPDSQTFTYVAGYGDPVTVPVGPDGSTTVQVVPERSGYYDFTAYSTDSTGVRSWDEDVYFRVASNAPTVASEEFPYNEVGAVLGTSGTFVFSSPVPGVVSYTYRFEPDYTPVTVPAGADGTASVLLTPSRSGGGDLWVTTTFADGTVSEQTDYTYIVASNAPSMLYSPVSPATARNSPARSPRRS